MKFSNVLFALALFMSVGIGFSSCSEDEAVVEPEPVNDLLGTWTMTGIDYNSERLTEIFGIPAATTIYTGTASNMTTTIAFAEDPANATITGTYDLDVQGTTLGQTQDATFTDQVFISNGTWAQVGSVITVTKPGGEISTLTVTELTATSLKVDWNYTTVEEEDAGPFTITTTTIATTKVTFTK
jgi:hypothetical protein